MDRKSGRTWNGRNDTRGFKRRRHTSLWNCRWGRSCYFSHSSDHNSSDQKSNPFPTRRRQTNHLSRFHKRSLRVSGDIYSIYHYLHHRTIWSGSESKEKNSCLGGSAGISTRGGRIMLYDVHAGRLTILYLGKRVTDLATEIPWIT